MNELFMYDLLKIHVHLIRIQCFEVYISGGGCVLFRAVAAWKIRNLRQEVNFTLYTREMARMTRMNINPQLPKL